MTAWWRSVQSSVDATCSRDDQRSSVKLHFEMLFNAISRAPQFSSVSSRSLHAHSTVSKDGPKLRRHYHSGGVYTPFQHQAVTRQCVMKERFVTEQREGPYSVLPREVVCCLCSN